MILGWLRRKPTASALVVDRLSETLAAALNTRGKVYAKFGEIKAVQTTEVTPIETVLADGRKETKNVAQIGDWIVTNPGGGRYVVKPEKFAKLYGPKAGSPGVYVPKGRVVAVQNTVVYKKPVSTMASWGEMQTGAADCWWADTCDEAGKREGNPRIIGAAEFAQTYRLVA